MLLLEMCPTEKNGIWCSFLQLLKEFISEGSDNFLGTEDEYSAFIVLVTFAFILALLGETVET